MVLVPGGGNLLDVAPTSGRGWDHLAVVAVVARQPRQGATHLPDMPDKVATWDTTYSAIVTGLFAIF